MIWLIFFISSGLKFTKIKICSLKNCRIRRFWESKIAKIDLLLEITKFYSKSQIVLTTAVSILWRCKSILKLNSIKYLLDAIFWTFLRYCIKLFFLKLNWQKILEKCSFIFRSIFERLRAFQIIIIYIESLLYVLCGYTKANTILYYHYHIFRSLIDWHKWKRQL